MASDRELPAIPTCMHPVVDAAPTTDRPLQDFLKLKSQSPIQGIDVAHQLWKLRHAKHMSDSEMELIMRTLAENIHSYDQVTEVR